MTTCRSCWQHEVTTDNVSSPPQPLSYYSRTQLFFFFFLENYCLRLNTAACMCFESSAAAELALAPSANPYTPTLLMVSTPASVFFPPDPHSMRDPTLIKTGTIFVPSLLNKTVSWHFFFFIIRYLYTPRPLCVHTLVRVKTPFFSQLTETNNTLVFSRQSTRSRQSVPPLAIDPGTQQKTRISNFVLQRADW